MDIIRLLPDSVANQIAAGEVVQRPASVVKELMENAIDAGASNVDVIILDAGRTSIQVIDDGKGMSETDARMAFERHATSKIQQAEDLFSLHTMGFRGEALPSISAVSQVRLTTRTMSQELGTCLSIEGSRVVSQEVCSCPVGANFEIRNLFYNVPARRKFLKSNQTELNNIIQEFERIALVNPSVSFSLTHGDGLISKWPATNLRQRIANVFGRKFNEQLLPVEVETSLVKLTGFVGKPASSRKKNVNQYFFVNGRYMRHPYFQKAVMEAYNHLIPEGEQIPYFLYFQVEPSNIDVNIHPTKTEIKFENETAIWQIILAAVRESLGKFNAVPTIEFDVEGRPDIPAFGEGKFEDVHAPQVHVNPEYNPFQKVSSKSHATSMANWEELYQGVQKVTPMEMFDVKSEPQLEQSLFGEELAGMVEISSEHFQFKGQYILTPVQSGLMLVEQHRAHVRILYDRFMLQMLEHHASTQGLLFPQIFQLPPSDTVLMEDIAGDISSLGFDITSLGGGSFSINGIPSGLSDIEPVGMLTSMIQSVQEDGIRVGHEMQHRLALVMARASAVVVGQVLSAQEMDSLINELFLCQNPNQTPTGQPIISILQQSQIDKMFS